MVAGSLRSMGLVRPRGESRRRRASALSTRIAVSIPCVAVGSGTQIGGSSKLSITASVFAELPSEALKPMPRFENAAQIRHSFAPLFAFWSAERIASRPSTMEGLQGWSLRPSITSWSARLLPPEPA